MRPALVALVAVAMAPLPFDSTHAPASSASPLESANKRMTEPRERRRQEE
jgi:hypothetical protein